MLENLKLRGRIFLGFSVPVILIIGFSGIVYSSGNKVFDTFKQVNRAQKAIIETDDMVLRSSLMARQVRGYLLIKDKESLKEYEKQRQRYQKAVEAADRVILDPEQRQIFTKMLQTGEQFDKLSRATFALVNEGKQQAAVTSYLRDSKIVIGLFDKLNEEFNEKQLLKLSSFSKNANESIQFLILMAVLTTVLSLFLATVAAYIIWSTIARTNKAINQTVNAIASSSTEIAAAVEQQERSATHQAASVHQTTSTMHELAASSRQSAEQAESAADSARQVLNLAESSAASALQVLNLAESSATGARQVLNLAEGGTKGVGRTLEGMSMLKQKVGAISEQIIRLSEQTNQISNITNIVSNLANQTNMLALNAAVEAVRAGEHGKGFGVVASEIRKLADQSKSSAEKINLLVAAIQSAINLTVMVTDEGRKTAEEGIKLSQETADAFTNVTQAINDVVLSASTGVAQSINDVVLNNQQTSLAAINDVVFSNQQISLTAKQQAIAVQQVVDAMNNLNQGASQTASGITQTKVSIQNLNEAAESLKPLVY
ncbi:CHASE3 domain-containing protein [Microcoleus sp. FACHB-831]|uniref:methyl-accepting chemotaxis protein n=1 Tax=Microcoleus sp. FACHB-831 TaxID=2692827 RepID=UPI001684B028|nr:methyl-accepting chemotaxis protein [Microcoleus sp. FACHB-831]MBD1924519.1 CHASE3 domain-containing protein [Microcoleus sp. FACHB-831]